LAHAFAIQIGTAFKYEAAIAIALGELERLGQTRLVILADPTEPYQAALTKRAVHSLGWTCGAWYTSSAQGLIPGALGLHAQSTRDNVREIRARTNQAVRNHRLPSVQAAIDVSDPEHRGGLLFYSSAENPLYARHTVPVIAAARQRGEAATLVLGP